MRLSTKDQEAIAKLYTEGFDNYSGGHNDPEMDGGAYDDESDYDSDERPPYDEYDDTEETDNSGLDTLSNEFGYPVEWLYQVITNLYNSKELKDTIEGDNYLGLYSFPLSLSDFIAQVRNLFKKHPEWEGNNIPKSSQLTSLIVKDIKRSIQMNNQDSEYGG